MRYTTRKLEKDINGLDGFNDRLEAIKHGWTLECWQSEGKTILAKNGDWREQIKSGSPLKCLAAANLYTLTAERDAARLAAEGAR